MDLIRIVDWGKHYENNRTRELKRMAWVPMPNRHDGDGYTELLDHVNGSAHFGAWCALIEVASRCEVRGTLLRDGGKPHDAESLERMTRVPVTVWQEALPRLVSIGWITISEIPSQSRIMVRDTADGNGTTSHPTAIERKERKEGKEGRDAPQDGAGNTPPFSAPPPQDEDWQVQLQVINPDLSLTESQKARAQVLATRETWMTVIAAYRTYQKAKPGHAFNFFLDEFGRWKVKIPARNRAPPPDLMAELKAEREQAGPEAEREARLAAAQLRKEKHERLTEEDQVVLKYFDGSPLSDHERELLGLQTYANREGQT